jgi:hypothetical protein
VLGSRAEEKIDNYLSHEGSAHRSNILMISVILPTPSATTETSHAKSSPRAREENDHEQQEA